MCLLVMLALAIFLDERVGIGFGLAEDEQRQHRLRKLASTASGREKLRERTAVEHRLAHISARKGPKARYRGIRKNAYDLRRAATIQNLETIYRNAA